ncbi:MAG TPA: hypothetical protein DCK81_01480 [Clostridiales bacterium UBA9856]|jgi:broad specificity phosphatase PhoE|nr:hypothetical protein [Clostridiales bacterium UBA9856]HOA42359.1 histidine phosphatase family protein [Bacillota bacterium]
MQTVDKNIESYIYLIRHGQPEMPGDSTYCIGQGSDPPLSSEGRRQAQALARCFEGLHFNKIYCSTLRRSRETAELLAAGRWPICQHEGLREINVGLWEGLPFDEIRAKYPEIYAARGEDWSVTPPGGESLTEVADRMEAAIKEIAALPEATNHILAVTHDGAIRGLLWKIMKPDTKKDEMIRQPYGSITLLKYSNGRLSVAAVGKLPEDYPTDEEIEQLWDSCQTPENVRHHCRAVCDEAMEICAKLKEAGVPLSQGQLRAASLLHDMCRTDGKEHPESAAKLLRERGYLRVARIVELHHGDERGLNLKDGLIDEAQVLYLADKRIQGTKKVTIEERFQSSLEKCTTEEAKGRHNARYREAKYIEAKINKILNTIPEKNTEIDKPEDTK